MDRDELMQLAAEKAVHEMSWESIEFLFRPSNMLELLLRLDFKGMEQKIFEWAGDNSPTAMPHRFRGEPLSHMLRTIEIEKFYRRLRSLHEEVTDILQPCK